MLTFKSREQNRQSVQIESESLLKAELPINVTHAFVTVFGDLVNVSRTSNYSDVILPEKDHIPGINKCANLVRKHIRQQLHLSGSLAEPFDQMNILRLRKRLICMDNTRSTKQIVTKCVAFQMCSLVCFENP